MSIKEFWQGSKQCWRDGINEMKSMGGGARFFANYSEGIMDTLGGQINTVLHPLKTAKPQHLIMFLRVSLTSEILML